MKLPKNFKTNHSLKKNNSLKLNYASDYFVSCNSEKDLFLIYDFLEEKKIKYWIFGDGTNVILKNNLKGLVIKNNFCLLYTSPSPRDDISSRMPSSA